MDPSDTERRSTERWMGVAEKLLMAQVVEGCKQFVSRALADDLVAAVDALLAAQRWRPPSGLPDPYAILGLDPALPASRDPDVVHTHYHRLSFLLNRSHPGCPCSLAFADAARLVADAWAFLSDPFRKASLDSDLDAAANAVVAAAARAPTPSQEKPQRQPPPPPQAASPPPARQPRKAATASQPGKHGRPPRAAKPQSPPDRQQVAEAPHAPPFWTACPCCCHVHQYDRSYEARTVLCPSCRWPFFDAAMCTPPPIVPGTDMYHCSWG